jgi:proton glutamate symport protein
MKLDLHWRIFIGLALGAILGYFFSVSGTDLQDPSLGIIKLSHISWIGDLFLKLLKMIVLPLIISSIIVGVGHLPVQSLGKVGLVTFLLFKGLMLFAAGFGLVFVNFFKPGYHIDLHSLIDSNQGADDVKFITESSFSFGDLIFGIVPDNIFKSLAAGSLLQIILVSILFSVALIKVKNGKMVLDFCKACLNAILKVTHWIMAISPFGIFALITKTVAIGGLSSLANYMPFVTTVLIAFAAMILVVAPILVHFFTDFTPLQFFSGMKEVMLTAFSTSSSAASIPITLETLEKKFNIPNKIASFVIPIGASMNMCGAAIYESIVTLFVAQAWLPEPLTLTQQIFVVGMVLLATFGTPGIPHGSLITMAIVFQAVGLPLEAIGVIISIDRILDMTRTMVNVTFDSLSCLILNKMFKNLGDNFPEQTDVELEESELSSRILPKNSGESEATSLTY